MKTAQQLLRACRREFERWCGDTTFNQQYLDKKRLDKELRSGRPDAAFRAAGWLDFRSVWYANHGALAVLNGDTAGWQELDRVLQYDWWAIRITKSILLVHLGALRLAHAIAFEEWRESSWLAALMIEDLDHRTFVGWEYAPFAAFLVRLWGLHTAEPILVERPGIAPLGVYDRIFQAWDDDERLRVAIAEMCDYHLQETLEQEGDSQFYEAPYNLFPVDVLALEAIRRRMGLSTPRPDHPLLATPLANPPPPEERPRMGPDPLLEAVLKKARDTGYLPPEETGT